MRLAAYAAPGSPPSWGVIEESRIVDGPGLWSGGTAPASLKQLLAEDKLGRLITAYRNANDEARTVAAVSAADAQLLAPLPDPGKIVAVGRNYLDHTGEGNLKLPKWPKLFPKFPSTIIGPDSPVVRPRITQQLDYEVELGVVIGHEARAVREEDAMAHVAGYTVLNDISARDLQFVDEQITLGKNFDSFTPMGPAIATVDELPDPHAIELSLRLNGSVMQESSTSHLIFSIPYLVSFISHVMTLFPGDVISTGTPAGVGCFRTPPVWLEHGDVLESTVRGVGTLVNRIEDGTTDLPERKV